METVLSEKYEDLFKWLSAEKESDLGKVDTVVITGGRYSQKSFATGLFTCIAAKDYNHRVLYTRYTLTSAEDSIIPELTDKIDLLNCHSHFEVKKDRILGRKNKSKIIFRGIKNSSGNQTANLKSLKDFSMFILEEAEEMPTFAGWDKIKKSIRALDVRNLSVLILNPTTKESWVYETFFEDKGVPEGWNGIKDNVLYIHSTYQDLERKYIDDAAWNEYEERRKAYEYYNALTPQEKAICDPKIVKKALYYGHIVKGGWLGKAEGVIYDNWTIGQFKEVGPVMYGQDFGFSIDPTSLIKVSIDKAQKKIYCKELLYETRLVTSQIISKNKQLAPSGLIYADSSEPRLIDEIRKGGVNIQKAHKPAGSITAGIAILQDFELIIDPESLNLIKELNHYVWHSKKSKIPIDAWNHLLDALRYVVFTSMTHRVIEYGNG